MTTLRVLLASAVFVLGAIVPAYATSPQTSFEGSGEAAGPDKRRCCETAVWMAQERSISLCDAEGRHEQVRAGTMRGLCKATRAEPGAQPKGSARDYRCTAMSRVTCR